MARIVKPRRFDDPVENQIEGELVETKWDIKRILIGLVILAAFGIIGSYFFWPSGSHDNISRDTLGISSAKKNVPPLPTTEDVEGIITGAKEALSQITSENLTSSQAAIQKIITDLEKLKGDKGAVGAVCSLLCQE